MNNDGEEKIKVIVTPKTKFNGWWRIWFVLSTIWFSGVLIKSTTEWFKNGLNKEITINPFAIYRKLDAKNKSLIFETQEQANGSDFKKVEIENHDNVILFRPKVDENQIQDFAVAYFNIGKEIQFKNRKDHIIFYSSFAIIPPIILLICGKTTAWIIKGFK
jgi:hypothetical protein